MTGTAAPRATSTALSATPRPSRPASTPSSRPTRATTPTPTASARRAARTRRGGRSPAPPRPRPRPKTAPAATSPITTATASRICRSGPARSRRPTTPWSPSPASRLGAAVCSSTSAGRSISRSDDQLRNGRRPRRIAGQRVERGHHGGLAVDDLHRGRALLLACGLHVRDDRGAEQQRRHDGRMLRGAAGDADARHLGGSRRRARQPDHRHGHARAARPTSRARAASAATIDQPDDGRRGRRRHDQLQREGRRELRCTAWRSTRAPRVPSAATGTAFPPVSLRAGQRHADRARHLHLRRDLQRQRPEHQRRRPVGLPGGRPKRSSSRARRAWPRPRTGCPTTRRR